MPDIFWSKLHERDLKKDTLKKKAFVHLLNKEIFYFVLFCVNQRARATKYLSFGAAAVKRSQGTEQQRVGQS